MLVLVTYDINITSADGQRRLRRVAKQCLNYGIRVQNSVFECILDQTQLTQLKHALLEIIDSDKDSLRIYRLGEHYRPRVEHYGVSPQIKVDEPLIL